MKIGRRKALKIMGATVASIPFLSTIGLVPVSAEAKDRKHKKWKIADAKKGKGKSFIYVEDIKVYKDPKKVPKKSKFKPGRMCDNCSHYNKKNKPEEKIKLADGKTDGLFSSCAMIPKHWVHKKGHCKVWNKKKGAKVK